MKLSVKDINLAENNGHWGIWFNIPNTLVDKFKKLAEKDCVKSIEIKAKHKNRSLQANKALWAMINDMAIELHTTSEELYLEALERYGVFTFIVVQRKALYRVKAEWRTVVEVGEVDVNGKPGVQLKCFYGSSQYDSKEFSRLLDGVITDAKEIGVEYISQEERNSIINNYERGK